MAFLCANGSNWGGISRFRNNHELFERFLGLPSNGNLDNIHTSAACSSTVKDNDKSTQGVGISTSDESLCIQPISPIEVRRPSHGRHFCFASPRDSFLEWAISIICEM